MHVTAAEAASLGLPGDEGARVEIPRWRYAVVNFPHPLLKRGLVILDTPGHAALAAEPELQLNRVPDADAIVFIASVDSGVTPTDRALYIDHIAPHRQRVAHALHRPEQDRHAALGQRERERGVLRDRPPRAPRRRGSGRGSHARLRPLGQAGPRGARRQRPRHR
jgi:hypothetical protein